MELIRAWLEDSLEQDSVRALAFTMMGWWFRLSAASLHDFRKFLRLPCMAYSTMRHGGPPERGGGGGVKEGCWGGMWV